MERRLAAILAADVAGYSKLMHSDEDATLKAWWSARKAIVDPLIAEHGGRIVKHTGDGFLAEFRTALSATNCAIAIQKQMNDRDATIPEEKQLRFRMGINLADIVDDSEDIHGDGVNIAARLEAISDPGGICVTGDVYNQVHHKVDDTFEDLGEQSVKNIAEPVRVWRWVNRSFSRADAFDTTEPPPFPDKTSIAVLPFANMSADTEQEFFADGITEDLITMLSNILGMFVVSRNSCFRYKGKSVDLQRVAGELGVRYVLEGSVRKAANRVRVTAQLIDAATGSHVWADRYDRDLTDVFGVQDDITANVVKALQVTLLEGEQARVWHRSTNNLEAWSCLTRAKAHFEEHLTVEENRAGIALLERAVELDPNYASAWTWLGWLLSHGVRWRSTDDPDAVMARAAQCAETALALDDGLAETHMLLALVHLLRRDFDKGIAHAERGVKLGPSNAEVTALLALSLTWAGRPEEALAWVEKAMRLSPMYSPWFIVVKAHALRLLGRFDEALKTYKDAIAATPGYVPPHIGLTLCYAEMGRGHDAREQARELLSLEPQFSIAHYLSTPGYKDKALTERSASALRQAGLPD